MKVWIIVCPEPSAHLQWVFIRRWFSFRTSYKKGSHDARHFCQECVGLLEEMTLNRPISDSSNWNAECRCLKTAWSQSITHIWVRTLSPSLCLYIFRCSFGMIQSQVAVVFCTWRLSWVAETCGHFKAWRVQRCVTASFYNVCDCS